ncbi:hypothetical protein ACHAP5_002640 [Fusarium lateritium]
MASTRKLFQLPSKPSWFENISIRPNGTILRIALPDDVPNQALTGICPLKPDVFAIGAGSYDLLGGTQSKPGSWSMWLADLTEEQPKVTKAADISEIGMINGIATWDGNTVLVTDCLYGKIYKLDTTTGSYSLALEDKTMTASEDAPFQVGINGIKVHRSSEQTYIYYSTTTRYSVYRVPVTQEPQAAGPVETLTSGVVVDDFVVARDGTIFVCTMISNTIARIPAADEGSVTVAGEAKSLAVAGSTACVFNEDETVLYVSTSGAHAMLVDGVSEPAKVVEVKLN